MKWNDIKTQSAEDLQKTLETGRAELVDLRFKASSGALKQVHLIAKVRKNMARVLTKLNQIKTTK
ncbi:MAG: 50S ribosomal protein L29 [Patescibacteria group bacterium]